MAYSKYTTLVTGYATSPSLRPAHPNGIDCASDAQYAERARAYEAWGRENFKSVRRAGICSAQTCKNMAAKSGIKFGISAEAASFDGSGKARHKFKKIDCTV